MPLFATPSESWRPCVALTRVSSWKLGSNVEAALPQNPIAVHTSICEIPGHQRTPLGNKRPKLNSYPHQTSSSPHRALRMRLARVDIALQFILQLFAVKCCMRSAFYPFLLFFSGRHPLRHPFLLRFQNFSYQPECVDLIFEAHPDVTCILNQYSYFHILHRFFRLRNKCPFWPRHRKNSKRA
jgi:hypothetical protein